MNPHFSRGSLLFEQGRYEPAGEEFRQAIALDPEDAHAHAMLALCLSELKQFQPATDAARQAIHLAPDAPFAHYALARVFCDRNRHEEALASITEAVRLDPTDSDYYSLLAGVHFAQSRWQESLEAANQGLQFDPEHIGCNNLRAMALVKLGRRADASATIAATLARNPENSATHANQGWACLERGDREKALEHFRESLRLDPENDWARTGIVEALKAGNIVYSLFLRYAFWMTKLSPRTQWAVIIGAFFGNRLLGGLAASNPGLAPWVWPIRILFLIFVFLTWTADPLFNLLLRLNRYGRLALSPEQVTASSWVGACVGLAMAALALGLLLKPQNLFFLASFVFGFLVIPLAALFKCSKGWPRTAMLAYTAVMAAAGVGALFCILMGDFWDRKGLALWKPLATTGMSVYVLAVIGSSWVANLLIMQRPKR
ncbi:MAG: tetratricopeptide repeat protein [Verrucomicrobia bacterium]|nr:tetratricopeptide repeat protein [Verrucomicrobiota bacterium]